jgi:GNAT superfamily N-acetyltransferase
MRRELVGGFELDDDLDRVDIGAVHAFISEESYWGPGRERELVERAIRGSTRVVGLYHDSKQVGFARVVSDGAIIGYLADVYVLEPYRGHGLGTELVREALEGGPGWDVRWLLHTLDAEGLYEKFGFGDGTDTPYRLMERARKGAAK